MITDDRTENQPNTLSPNTLLIDWAGTITIPPQDMIVNMAAKLGFAKDDLASAFGSLAQYLSGEDSPVHRAERGEIDDDELRDFLDSKAPGAGQFLDPSNPLQLDGADRPEMIGLLEELREAEVPVALVTNNFASAQDLLAGHYLDTQLVNAIVNSALIGYRKPEVEFFQIALEATGIEPHEALFVDDFAHNVAAAEALGIPSLLITPDTGPTIKAVRSAFGL